MNRIQLALMGFGSLAVIAGACTENFDQFEPGTTSGFGGSTTSTVSTTKASSSTSVGETTSTTGSTTSVTSSTASTTTTTTVTSTTTTVASTTTTGPATTTTTGTGGTGGAASTTAMSSSSTAGGGGAGGTMGTGGGDAGSVEICDNNIDDDGDGKKDCDDPDCTAAGWSCQHEGGNGFDAPCIVYSGGTIPNNCSGSGYSDKKFGNSSLLICCDNTPGSCSSQASNICAPPLPGDALQKHCYFNTNGNNCIANGQTFDTGNNTAACCY